MNNRKLFPGGEIEISSDELNLMPDANREGMDGISDGLGESVDYIMSGVGAIINAGVDVSVSDGFVFLDGELIKVDAQVVPRTVGTDLYEFQKVSTFPDVNGLRNFRDGSTNNVYEHIRAIPVNVAAIVSLDVTGSNLSDILKSIIQVQSDVNQADNTQPDFIKNFPNVIDVLMQGKVTGIQVGTGGGATAFSGDITGIVDLNVEPSELRIRVTFPSIGTTDYHPILTLKSDDPDWDKDNDVFCMVKNLTATTFEVLFKEVESLTQNLSLLITVIPF